MRWCKSPTEITLVVLVERQFTPSTRGRRTKARRQRRQPRAPGRGQRRARPFQRLLVVLSWGCVALKSPHSNRATKISGEQFEAPGRIRCETDGEYATRTPPRPPCRPISALSFRTASGHHAWRRGLTFLGHLLIFRRISWLRST